MRELFEKYNICNIATSEKTIIKEYFQTFLNVIPSLFVLFILFFSLSSLAEKTTFDKQDFFIKLSIDNNIMSSQNMSTDLAFSAISGLGYLARNSYHVILYLVELSEQLPHLLLCISLRFFTWITY